MNGAQAPGDSRIRWAVHPDETYWLSFDDGHTWEAVSRRWYVLAERSRGFFPNGTNDPGVVATAAFSSNGLMGKALRPGQRP